MQLHGCSLHKIFLQGSYEWRKAGHLEKICTYVCGLLKGSSIVTDAKDREKWVWPEMKQEYIGDEDNLQNSVNSVSAEILNHTDEMGSTIRILAG